MIRQLRLSHLRRRQEPGHRDRPGTLNVIIKSAESITVTLEDSGRVVLGKVFPLKQDIREFPDHRLNEGFDEVIVFLAAHPLVPPAEIQRIVQQITIVSTYIQHDWHRCRRMNSRAQRVQRELANRNAHAANTEIAESEYALAIG